MKRIAIPLSGSHKAVGFLRQSARTDRIAEALRRRARRAQRLQATVLAGGYGRAAQEAAWSAWVPYWRWAVSYAIHMRPITDSERRIRAVAETMVDSHPMLKLTWPKLLLQELRRRDGRRSGGRGFPL